MDCSHFVRGCLKCQKVKHSNSASQSLMQVKSPQEAWSVVDADIQGPLPPTTNHFKFLFVAVDDLTKFVVVKPLRVADGKRIWESLNEKVFTVFGIPKKLHVDNGTEFDNDLLRKKCDERNIDFFTNPPYHP